MSKEKMVNYNDLKSITVLNYLKDSMLDKLSSITSIEEYRSGDYIFNEGEDAKNLYAVIEGKVRLEIDKKYTTRISINDIIQGMIFGFSALVDTQLVYPNLDLELKTIISPNQPWKILAPGVDLPPLIFNPALFLDFFEQ